MRIYRYNVHIKDHLGAALPATTLQQVLHGECLCKRRNFLKFFFPANMRTKRDMVGWDAKDLSPCKASIPLLEEVATRMAGSLRSLSASD